MRQDLLRYEVDAQRGIAQIRAAANPALAHSHYKTVKQIIGDAVRLSQERQDLETERRFLALLLYVRSVHRARVN
jgi:hypothetical protein